MLIAEQAARLDAGVADLLHGKVLLAMNAPALAVHHLEAACAIAAPYFQARLLLAQALRAAGRHDDARAAMEVVAAAASIRTVRSGRSRSGAGSTALAAMPSPGCSARSRRHRRTGAGACAPGLRSGWSSWVIPSRRAAKLEQALAEDPDIRAAAR